MLKVSIVFFVTENYSKNKNALEGGGGGGIAILLFALKDKAFTNLDFHFLLWCFILHLPLRREARMKSSQTCSFSPAGAGDTVQILLARQVTPLWFKSVWLLVTVALGGWGLMWCSLHIDSIQ